LAKHDPDDRQAPDLLMTAELSPGKSKEEDRVLNEALKRNPKNAEPSPFKKLPAVKLQEALMKIREKDEPGARAELEEELVREPENRQAVTALAEWCLSVEGMSKAVAEVEKCAALAKAGQIAQVREAFARAVAGDGNYLQVRRAKLEETTGNNQAASEHLAFNLASDSPDKALQYAQSAVEFLPSAAFPEDTLGLIYYRKDVYDKALKCLDRVLREQPNALSRYHLALAYDKSRDGQLAHQNLAAASKGDANLSMPERLPN
jgi:tetratricopeptide (TPR) repeat protein